MHGLGAAEGGRADSYRATRRLHQDQSSPQDSPDVGDRPWRLQHRLLGEAQGDQQAVCHEGTIQEAAARRGHQGHGQEYATCNLPSRLLDERDVLKEINNPFTAKFYYSFQNDTKLYFVIEYIEGGDLLQLLIAKGKFSEDWTRFYAAELVLALEHLHSRGIVYRDLKGNNIMLERDGHIKVVDFGLAKFLNQARANTICGTPNYIAPEVLAGRGYTKTVDWWSLVRSRIATGRGL